MTVPTRAAARPPCRRSADMAPDPPPSPGREAADSKRRSAPRGDFKGPESAPLKTNLEASARGTVRHD